MKNGGREESSSTGVNVEFTEKLRTCDVTNSIECLITQIRVAMYLHATGLQGVLSLGSLDSLSRCKIIFTGYASGMAVAAATGMRGKYLNVTHPVSHPKQ